MLQRNSFPFLWLLLIPFFLWGCPKKVEIIPERPRFVNPLYQFLENFSSVETLQARTSIRIDTVRDGEEMSFVLNGFLLYQRPDKLRLLGYHVLGMGLFDALYREGEFFLLIPSQKKAYTGEISKFEELVEKAGEIKVSSERTEGKEIPSRIWIDLPLKETQIELRLKEIVLNPFLSESAFQWIVPEGVEVRSIERLLKGKRR
ncbi:MAG: hypothetical protein ACUVTN_12010 [Thermodesulfobacteriota bacterium]